MKKSTILIIVIVLIAAISIGTYYTMSNKNKEKTIYIIGTYKL